ncbi:MAG: tetratricopeptide repeat protein [Rhodothermaceae bacterium]
MPLFNEIYQEAFNLFKLEKFDDAFEKLHEAEKEYQTGDETNGINYEDIYVLKGTIALTLGRIDDAQTAFESALESNPHSTEAAMGMGQVLYSSGMINEAEGMFTWVVENDPENDRALQILERIKRESGDSVEELVEVNDQISNMFENAYELFLANKYSESMEIVDDIEVRFKEEIQLLKGNILLGQGKFQKALDSFKKALEINKENSPACNGLAETYEELGQFEDAKIMYEYAIKINPNDQYALLGLAEINQKLGHSPLNNVDGFFGNLDLNDQIKTQLDIAYTLFEEKEFVKAINKLNEVITELKETDLADANELRASLNNFKGFNYLALNEKKEAREMFETSLKFNPESSQACAGLGEVAFLDGDDKTAKTMFEWGVVNNPRNVFAIAGLAKINKVLNLPEDHNSIESKIKSKIGQEFENAIEEAYEEFNKKNFKSALIFLEKAEKYINKSSNDEDIKKSYSSVENFKGFCYLSLNENDCAKECFEKSLSINPKSSQACAGLAEIFYLNEDDTSAKEMFEWALRNEPANKFAIAGLEKVSEKNEIKEITNKELSEQISGLITESYSLFNEKNYTASIDKLLEADNILEINYSREEAFFSRAGVNNFIGFNFLHLNDNVKSKKYYEMALELNPESSQAAAGLGELLYQDGEDESAKKMFEYAVKYNPQNKYAVNGLAKVNETLGHVAEHSSLEI